MASKTVAAVALAAMMTVGSVALLAPGAGAQRAATRIGQPAPEISGGPWINSQPLSLEKLRGRVVFVDFWTAG